MLPKSKVYGETTNDKTEKKRHDQRKEEARRRSVHTEEGSDGAEDNENVRWRGLTETVFG
jgi:hypothetical protein